MRFILTYLDANKQKKIRFFKTFNETQEFITYLRNYGSSIYSNFEIKVIKP